MKRLRRIRARLSLASALIVSLAGGMFAVILFLSVSGELAETVRDFADHESEEVAIIAARYSTAEELRAHIDEFRPLFPEQGVLELAVFSPRGDSVIRLVEKEDVVSPIIGEMRNLAARGLRVNHKLEYEGRDAVFCTRPVRNASGLQWMVVAIVDATHANATLVQFAAYCASGLLAVIAVVWAGSWFLLLLFTKPLNRVISQAREIVEGRSDALLPSTGADFELAELVSLLNRLLGDNREALTRLKRFTSDAGHELRTPLTRIQTCVESSLQAKQPADYANALQLVLEEATNMRAIVDGLLELARGEAIGLQYKKDFALRQLVEPLFHAGEDLASEKHITLHLHLQDEINIEGNEQLLQRALWNVVENAVKFSPESSTVTIAIATDESFVRIEVSDRGPGVRSEDLERIFEPFVQLDSDRASGTERAGFGLGLSIARSIVRRHSGELWAESPPDGGLRIVIRLRRRQPIRTMARVAM